MEGFGDLYRANPRDWRLCGGRGVLGGPLRRLVHEASGSSNATLTCSRCPGRKPTLPAHRAAASCRVDRRRRRRRRLSPVTIDTKKQNKKINFEF